MVRDFPCEGRRGQGALFALSDANEVRGEGEMQDIGEGEMQESERGRERNEKIKDIAREK